MGAMTEEHDDAVTYRGARFEGADFNGATFRDCDMRGVKVVDTWLVDANISGLIDNLVVNDVDVTAFVEAELDRRNPERAQVRRMQTADEYRATFLPGCGMLCTSLQYRGEEYVAWPRSLAKYRSGHVSAIA